MSTTHYTTRGSVRGGCGHKHRTEEAAERCAERDHRDCAAAGGYSDRKVVEVTVHTTAAERLAAMLPCCTVWRGHILAGAGSALHGWGARTAAGETLFLGHTEASATESAREHGSDYGAGR